MKIIWITQQFSFERYAVNDKCRHSFFHHRCCHANTKQWNFPLCHSVNWITLSVHTSVHLWFKTRTRQTSTQMARYDAHTKQERIHHRITLENLLLHNHFFAKSVAEKESTRKSYHLLTRSWTLCSNPACEQSCSSLYKFVFFLLHFSCRSQMCSLWFPPR